MEEEEDGQNEDKDRGAQPDASELTAAGCRGLRGVALWGGRMIRPEARVGFAVRAVQGGF